MVWSISFIHGSSPGSELCSLAWMIMKINSPIDTLNLKKRDLEEKMGGSNERRCVSKGEV
jgi:hypothetical protein